MIANLNDQNLTSESNKIKSHLLRFRDEYHPSANSENNADQSDLLLHNTTTFLSALKHTPPSERRTVRNWLKALLQIWLQDFEPSEQGGKDDSVILIFQEIMKDPRIFLKFWANDISNNSPVFRFVQEKLFWFPLNTLHFISISKIISGNKQLNFTDNLVDYLSNVNILTFKYTNFAFERCPEQDRELDQHQDIQRTKELINLPGNLTIPEHTLFYFPPSNRQVAHFLIDNKFWETLWLTVTHKLNVFFSHTGATISTEEIEMFSFICHLIHVKPTILEKFEQLVQPHPLDSSDLIEEKENAKKNYIFLIANETQNKAPGATIIVFLMDLLRLCLEIDSTESLTLDILHAILSLLNSPHRYTTQKVIYWYATFCDSVLQSENLFVLLVKQLDLEERNHESFGQNEKICLQIRTQLLLITRSLFIDDSIVWTQLKPLPGSENSLFHDEFFKKLSNFETTSLKPLFTLHNDLVGKSLFHHQHTLTAESWQPQAHFLNDLIAFLNLKDFTLGSNLLENLVGEVVVPLSDRVMKDMLTVTTLETPSKYQLLTALHDTCSELVKKLEQPSSRSQLNIRFNAEISVQNSDLSKNDVSYIILRKMISDLNINELLIECLEARVSHASFGAQSSSGLKLDNKHWVVNVIQKKHQFCSRAIREYLASGLNLLAQSVKTAHAIPPTNVNPLKDVIKNFCLRDSIFKYTFQYENENKTVNILAAIAHLFNFDFDKGFLNAPHLQPFALDDVKLSFEQNVFETTQGMFASLKKLSDSQLFNRPYDQILLFDRKLSKDKLNNVQNLNSKSKCFNSQYTDNNLDSPYWYELAENDQMAFSSGIDLLCQSPVFRLPSLRAAVLNCLNTLSLHWNFKLRLQKPNLYEFIAGIKNDLPSARLLFTHFKKSLTVLLLKDSGPEVPLALSFLIQSAKSQPKFFNNLFPISTDFEKNKLLQSLKIIIKRTSTKSGFYSDPEILREIRVKISALFFMLLINGSLPKKIQLSIWEEFFIDGFRFAIEEFFAATESTGESTNFIFKNMMDAIKRPIDSPQRESRIEEEESDSDSNHSLSEPHKTPEERNFQINILLDKVAQMNSTSSLLRLYLSLIELKWFSVNDSHRVFNVKKFIKSGLDLLFKKNLGDLASSLFHLKNSVHEQIRSELGALLPRQLKHISNECYIMSRSLNPSGESYVFHHNNETLNHYLLDLNPNSDNPLDPTKLLKAFSDKSVYLSLKSLGITEFNASLASYLLLSLNALERLSIYHHSLQSKSALLFATVTNQGLEGTPAGATLNLRPMPNQLAQYLFTLSKSPAISSQMRKSDTNKLLPNKNQDRFFEHWNLRSDIRLSPIEQGYVNFFYLDTAWKEVNLAWLLGSQKDGKLTANSCLQMITTITPVLNKLNIQVAQSIKSNEPQSYSPSAASHFNENAVSRISKIFFSWSSHLLRGVAHIILNLLNCHSQDAQNETHCESVQSHLAPHLKNNLLLFANIIKHQLKSLSADTLPVSEALMSLMYLLYSIKLVSNGPIDDASLVDILNLNQQEIGELQPILIFLKKKLRQQSSPELQGLLIMMYDWLVNLHPPFITTTDLNNMALNLQKPNVTDDTFVLTAHFFTRLCKRAIRENQLSDTQSGKSIHQRRTSSHTPNRLYSSAKIKHILPNCELLACLSKTERFSNQPQFESKQFYEEAHRVPLSAHFKLALELFVLYLQAFPQKPESTECCNYVFEFINKHFQRFLSILSLSPQALKPQLPNSPMRNINQGFQGMMKLNSQRIIQPFNNLAFMEELDSIAHLLAILSNHSQFWQIRQQFQFNVINSVLLQKTIQLFTTKAPGISNLGPRNQSTSHLLDQIIPVSKHEHIFREVAITKRKGLTSNLMPAVHSSHFSVKHRKASMRSESHHFNHFRKQLVNSSQSEDLFQLKVDLISIQVCYNYMNFFFNTWLDFKPQNFVPRPTGNLLARVRDLNSRQQNPIKILTQFNPFFWTEFSEQLVSIQLFILSSLNKLNSEPDSLRENHLKLRILESSPETYASTHGCNVTQDVLPLEVYSTLLKQAFQMSLYVQNLLFFSFDQTEVYQKPAQIQSLQQHKHSSTLLIEDFKKLCNNPAANLASSSARLKPSRFTNQPMTVIQEENGSDAPEFLNFMEKYYPKK